MPARTDPPLLSSSCRWSDFQHYQVDVTWRRQLVIISPVSHVTPIVMALRDGISYPANRGMRSMIWARPPVAPRAPAGPVTLDAPSALSSPRRPAGPVGPGGLRFVATEHEPSGSLVVSWVDEVLPPVPREIRLLPPPTAAWDPARAGALAVIAKRSCPLVGRPGRGAGRTVARGVAWAHAILDGDESDPATVRPDGSTPQEGRGTSFASAAVTTHTQVQGSRTPGTPR
jgi:hypothetical protein